MPGGEPPWGWGLEVYRAILTAVTKADAMDRYSPTAHVGDGPSSTSLSFVRRRCLALAHVDQPQVEKAPSPERPIEHRCTGAGAGAGTGSTVDHSQC